MSKKKYNKEFIDNYFKVLESTSDNAALLEYFRKEHGITYNFLNPELSELALDKYEKGRAGFEQILATIKNFGPEHMTCPPEERMKMHEKWVNSIEDVCAAATLMKESYYEMLFWEVELCGAGETQVFKDVMSAAKYLTAYFTPKLEAARKELPADNGNERG